MEMPKIRMNVLATDKDGHQRYCYLSKYNEWRCAMTGMGLLIDVVKWEYSDVKFDKIQFNLNDCLLKL